MKEIPLTQGKVALVDDEDYEYLMQWKWQADYDGYNWCAKRTGYKPKKKFNMHRVVMNAKDGQLVDHHNHNGLDNRKCNLRICTSAQNAQNRSRQVNNSSGYKGVYWRGDVGKWQVSIRLRKKNIHLGYFSNIKDAAKEYDKAAIAAWGEFAKTNILTS